MDKYQRHSIAIMIDSIEQQLKGLRALLALGANLEDAKVHDVGPKASRGYTDREEDAAIEQLFDDVPRDSGDVFMQDIFKQAQQTLGEHATTNDIG